MQLVKKNINLLQVMHSNEAILKKSIFFVIALSALVFMFMEHNQYVGPLLVMTVICISVYLVFLSFKESVLQRNKIFAAMLLTAFYIVFLILLQQSGGALNLFTDSFVDRTLWGFTIETGAFQSIEPLSLIFLTPIYNYLWTYQESKNKSMADGAKFIWALILMSSSFILMAFAMNFANEQGLISMTWINITYFLQAAGELFIGPIGLAMISRLIPQKILGLYMGYWVLATAVANFIAAKIGAFITPSDSLSQQASHQVAIDLYQSSFYKLSLLGFISVALLFLLLPKLKKLTN